EEVVETLVRVLRGSEARELAHRPDPCAVHLGMEAAGEGKLPGLPQPFLEAGFDVFRRIERLNRDPGERLEERCGHRRLRGLRSTRLWRGFAAPGFGLGAPRRRISSGCVRHGPSSFRSDPAPRDTGKSSREAPDPRPGPGALPNPS